MKGLAYTSTNSRISLDTKVYSVKQTSFLSKGVVIVALA